MDVARRQTTQVCAPQIYVRSYTFIVIGSVDIGRQQCYTASTDAQRVNALRGEVSKYFCGYLQWNSGIVLKTIYKFACFVQRGQYFVSCWSVSIDHCLMVDLTCLVLTFEDYVFTNFGHWSIVPLKCIKSVTKTGYKTGHYHERWWSVE